MYSLLSFVFSLIGLAIATYTDFRDRTIPDWVSLGMGVLGFAFAAHESYVTSSIQPLLVTGGVVLATYILAYVFWRAGAWAGGDVKLFVGLAALNPFNPFIGSLLNLSLDFAGREWIVASTLPVFMLNLFIFSVVALIPYTSLLAFSALKTAAHRKAFTDSSLRAIKTVFEYTLVLLAITFFLNTYSLPLILTIVFVLALSLLPRMVRLLVAAGGLILIILAYIPLASALTAFGLLLALDLLFTWYGFARAHALSYSKKISDLQDGDIAGEWIVKREGRIVREPGVSFKTIIKAGAERDLSTLMKLISPESGDALASPRQAAGLYPDQIVRLQHEVKLGHLEDKILVKASSPFAPAVLIAYLMLAFLGDGPLAWGFG